MTTSQGKDHGGNLDAAIAQYGGTRDDWIDLSTGINPLPYPTNLVPHNAWAALPDQRAMDRLKAAARAFWAVPDGAEILAAPGCSALIAQIPTVRPATTACIKQPTYNEHAASFELHGWSTNDTGGDAHVLVHPNNPTGAFWEDLPAANLRVIDESFCDIAPEQSHITAAAEPGTLILKSFGKFWGLAGLRLGFAIGDPDLIAALRDRLGPWAVSGPALHIGADALENIAWAKHTRARLETAAATLDRVMLRHCDQVLGNVSLFRTYETPNAQALHERLARAHIWTRVFPYNPHWIRLGLPAPNQWDRLRMAL